MGHQKLNKHAIFCGIIFLFFTLVTSSAEAQVCKCKDNNSRWSARESSHIPKLIPQALSSIKPNVDLRARWSIVYRLWIDQTGKACKAELEQSSEMPTDLKEMISQALLKFQYYKPAYLQELKDQCIRSRLILITPRTIWQGQHQARKKRSDAKRKASVQYAGYKLDPDLLQKLKLYHTNGKNQLEERDFERATRSFTAAIELLPSKQELVNSGKIKKREKLSEVHRESLAQLYAYRGWTYLKIGLITPAIRDFRQSKEYDNLPYVYAALGEAYRLRLVKGRHNRSSILIAQKNAAQEYKKAIEYYPYDPQPRYGLATVYYRFCIDPRAIHWGCKGRSGMLSSALSNLDDATRLSPKYAEAYMLKALVKLELNRLSIPDAETAIRLHPQNAEAYYVRGLLASRSRSQSAMQDAVKYAQKALELDPGNERYSNAAAQWEKPYSDGITSFIVGLVILSMLAGDGSSSSAQNNSGYEEPVPGTWNSQMFQNSLPLAYPDQ